jgi:hypothetical protein
MKELYKSLLVFIRGIAGDLIISKDATLECVFELLESVISGQDVNDSHVVDFFVIWTRQLVSSHRSFFF